MDMEPSVATHPIGREHCWATEALRSEANDLIFLAECIQTSSIRPVPGLDDWQNQVEAILKSPTFGSLGSEKALDRLAHDLRTLWLRYAQGIADRTMRSPTAQQQPAVTGTGTVMPFGYERELDPAPLEARCGTFYSTLPGWTANHLLFSSGQATLSTILHHCSGLIMSRYGRQPRLLHLGGYFETTELLTMFAGGQFQTDAPHHDGQAAALTSLPSVDILLIELVYCDGRLRVFDIEALARAWRQTQSKPPIVIFDSTLLSTRFPLEELLGLFSGPDAPMVFRINSGLKLDQGGLELANVGICSVLTPDGSDLAPEQITEELRRIRKLTGAGLGLQDLAALEAPWFLDPLYAKRYCDSVFANNRCLARLFKPTGTLFAELSHPAVIDIDHHWAEAPFCTLLLRDPSPDAYHRLEAVLASEAARRNLAVDTGGSFGFRGHRFEAIVPENGTAEPFLRIALGARGGPTVGGMAKLLNDLGAAHDIADLARRYDNAGRPA